MAKHILVISIAIALTLAMTCSIPADVPQLISFQGMLYDSGGNPLKGQYEVTFRIYDVDEGGIALWTETDSVRCEEGLYNIILGLLTPLILDFNSQYWLGIGVSGDDELLPRYRLVSVPTAFRAQIADQVGWTDLIDVPTGFADGIDDVGAAGGVSQINAGPGVHVTNPTGPTTTVAADIGTDANQVAAGDHHHDNDYVGKGETNSVTGGMIVDGTIKENDVSFVIGAGDITEVTAGTGLSGGGTTGDITLNVKVPLELSGTAPGTGAIISGTNTGSGHGVLGTSVSNYGVYGTSASGVGVLGECDDGAGVAGYSENGFAGYFDGKSYFGGNVGIGTTNPDRPLDVVEDSPWIVWGPRFWNSNPDGYMRMFLISGGTAPCEIYFNSGEYDYEWVLGMNYKDFMINRGQSDTRFFIDRDTGWIGIGTMSPSTEFDVVGTIYSRSGGFKFPDGTIQTTAAGSVGKHSLDAADGDPINAVYVDNAGKVGVGTTSPHRLLHMVGPNPRVLIEASSSNPEINFTNSGDADTDIWSMYKNGTTGDLRFYQNGDRVTFEKNTGNVGIGLTDPMEKLDVNGNIRADNIAGLSDVRLKKEIQTVDNALERITSIRGVNFRWKNEDKSDDLQMGVIAQELEPVFPEAVLTDDNGFKSVTYGKLVVPLIEAVKDLKKENERLRHRVEALEQRDN